MDINGTILLFSGQNYGNEESASPQTPQNRPDPVFTGNHEKLEYGNNHNNNNKNNNNNNNNYYNPSPVETTEEPYTTTRRTTKTTVSTTTTAAAAPKPVRMNADDGRPLIMNNNGKAKLVTLQSSTIDSGSDLNGVINGFLQNENNTNKTVIITVVEKTQQNRPTNTGTGESRPTVNGGERPSGQKPTTTTTLRPNYNHGEDTAVATRSYGKNKLYSRVY